MRALSIFVLAACGGAPASTPLTNTAPATDAVAVSLAINLQEIWVGNEDHETDPAATYRGALHAIEDALDHLSLPPGSTIAVTGFSTGAKQIVAREPANKFRGSDLGIQRAYRGAIGTDLFEGVKLAGEELERTPAARKLLVILGDGNDTNNEHAKPAFAELAKHWAGRIEVRAIIWKSAISSDSEIVSAIAPGATVTASTDAALEAAIKAALR